MNRRLWILIPILICLSVAAIMFCYYIDTDRVSQRKLPASVGARGAVGRVIKFLYLVQTESCLPGHLRSVDALGNASFCQCDILVLSYKQPCNDTLSLPHVEYIFNSSTTWTTGRNLLFEIAMQRRGTYLYYIFIDDDIVLVAKQNKNINPWRKFEDSLERIEPAVGVLAWDHMTKRGHKWVHKTNCRLCLYGLYQARQKKRCSLNETTEFIPVVAFDPAFNAFHHQSVQYILPYSNRYDTSNWWYSQVYFNIKCEIMFQGQVVVHTIVSAVNTKHRPYPRVPLVRSIVDAIVKEIEGELPKEYQNTSLMMEWKKKGRNHELTSTTLCLQPPPPHKLIQPYAHFKMQ